VIVRDWENDLRSSTEVTFPAVADSKAAAVASVQGEESEPQIESVVDASVPIPSLMSVLGVGETERGALLQVI